jgi:zinc protease
MGLSEARKYETGFQKAGFLSQILEYNLPEDFSKKQNELLNKITKEELLSLAKKRLPDTDKMNIVLVGDKAKVWNNLQKFGYEVVELEKDGNPVKQ